jgi:Cof subfamily protein (haloacid dehalogenase superfamily)
MRDRVRLIATDLDGTLLRSDRTVSRRTRDAIAAVQTHGILVVIATARHPLTAKRFADEAGVTGLAICANGALVYDLARDEISRHQTLAIETALMIVERLRAGLPDLGFAVIRGMEFACEPAYAAIAGVEEHGRTLDEVHLAEVDVLLRSPVTKLIARHPRIAPVELFAALTALGIDGYESALSGAPFVDVTAPGVSKAAALAGICADLGIAASEVVAFGDAPNDLPMLRWAGRPIAVANAYPEVLAEIAESTAANDDDGVAIALERLIAEMPG